jgi:type II secretory pathway pseudopilin PulG
MKFEKNKTTRRSRSAHRPREASGFTFVEVLAAMLFMAIVIPAAVQGITLANRAGVIAERKTMAAQLADTYLTELIITEQWQTMTPSGAFPGVHSEYKWQLNQRNWDIDPMIYLELEVLFTVQGREYIVRTGTLVEEPEA